MNCFLMTRRHIAAGGHSLIPMVSNDTLSFDWYASRIHSLLPFRLTLTHEA